LLIFDEMVKYVMNLDLIFLAFEKETFLDF
jgi:hypothetical protein